LLCKMSKTIASIVISSHARNGLVAPPTHSCCDAQFTPSVFIISFLHSFNLSVRLSGVIMADMLDEELIAIINRLKKVQQQVGGGKKENSLANDHGGKVDRFVDLYDRMNERLEIIKNIIDDIRKNERVPGSNPKDLIANQSKVRTELAAVNDEWNELDTIYRLEAKKKRSRFTPEQLSARQQMLMNLQQVYHIINSHLCDNSNHVCNVVDSRYQRYTTCWLCKSICRQTYGYYARVRYVQAPRHRDR
jgi:hypothetical protein